VVACLLACLLAWLVGWLVGWLMLTPVKLVLCSVPINKNKQTKENPRAKASQNLNQYH
jgi:hypothetical protein